MSGFNFQMDFSSAAAAAARSDEEPRAPLATHAAGEWARESNNPR
jgi:hypothetical protein